MKTLILLVVTLFSYSANAQTFYSFESGKTLNTNYKTPYLGLSVGYRFINTETDETSLYTVEAGLKTNFQEYFTTAYFAGGIQTPGKFLAAANVGAGWTFNIPQLDRKYNPATGQTVVITDGYKTKSIFALQASAKIGYEVVSRVKIYGSYSVGFRNWAGGGILFQW